MLFGSVVNWGVGLLETFGVDNNAFWVFTVSSIFDQDFDFEVCVGDLSLMSELGTR